MEYVCDIKGESNYKADLGTCVHKALEILAQKQIAAQNNEIYIENGADLIDCYRITPEFAMKESFKYYSELRPISQTRPKHQWSDSDFSNCLDWLNNILTFNKGEFNPANRKVVASEKYFDIEIKEKWSHYNYVLEDITLSNYLRLMGTIDLIFEVDSDTLEIFDLKTGRTTHFPSGKKKTNDDFYEEQQFLIYYYAAKHLFPHIKNFLFSIYFAQFNQLFSVAYTENDYEYAKEVLKTTFLNIKGTKIPKIHTGFWCKYLCNAGMNKFDGENITICESTQKMIRNDGLDKTLYTIGNVNKIGTYGTGGGK